MPTAGQVARATTMHVRDVPESCTCIWDWQESRGRWVMFARMPGCPWHTPGGNH